MPISFANIPANIKVPLYWVEVDPSMAGLPNINLRALMVGIMTSDGNATHDVPIPIGSQAQADQAFGPGSELSRMFQAYYSNNFANEVWGLPMAEPTGGSAATGEITITAAPTSAGTLWLYIAGSLVNNINIMTTDTVDDIATAITDQINNAYLNGDPALPVSAAAAAGVVTLTSLFKGVNANEITVSLNYYGALGGQQTPVGLGITLPAGGVLAGGVGVPDFTVGISNIQKQQFEYVAMPYSDTNSLFAWDQEYGFTDSGRWGWQRQQFGHIFCAKRGTYSNLILFGETLNSGVESIMAMETTCPSPMFEVAAAYAAKAQRALVNDPARPLQTLSLNNIKAAPLQDRFDFPELNSLALTGMAIQEIGSDNQPMILREQTTYQLNLYGQSDDAYELVTTLATLAKLLRNQKQAITSKFPRSKLADDGTKFGPGQAIVTPGIIKAELVSEYQLDMWNGLVENLSAFKTNLMVERDPNDPNRVNVLYPPDLINQLRIFACLAQFRLQTDRGIDVQTIGPASGPFNAAGGTPQ
jgi:phage tail sheath gpL-like